ncbi:hypothetical protein [uncultured Microbacterium sp.]|uniref:hypothetical protein n=1 Tax=uncultured Microbacterium sp. TaxID=191216 RepID=UPI0025D446D0|nr:hypothetical protein [uncultured Microbacterium sp.]
MSDSLAARIERALALLPGIGEIYRTSAFAEAVGAGARMVGADTSLVSVRVGEITEIEACVGTDGTLPAAQVARAARRAIRGELGDTAARIRITLVHLGAGR